MGSLSKATKIIMKPSPEITIKHVVSFGGKDIKGNPKPLGSTFDYQANGQQKTMVTFETFDSIVIESSSAKNKDGKNLNISLSYGEMFYLMRALDFTKNWLEKEAFRV